MTDTDFRALCAELVELDQAEPGDYANWRQNWNAAIARARAALAQPEPQGPTDEELCEFFRANDDLSQHCEAGTDWDEPLMMKYEFPVIARAVLARWGNR